MNAIEITQMHQQSTTINPTKQLLLLQAQRLVQEAMNLPEHDSFPLRATRQPTVPEPALPGLPLDVELSSLEAHLHRQLPHQWVQHELPDFTPKRLHDVHVSAEFAYSWLNPGRPPTTPFVHSPEQWQERHPLLKASNLQLVGERCMKKMQLLQHIENGNAAESARLARDVALMEGNRECCLTQLAGWESKAFMDTYEGLHLISNQLKNQHEVTRATLFLLAEFQALLRTLCKMASLPDDKDQRAIHMVLREHGETHRLYIPHMRLQDTIPPERLPEMLQEARAYALQA